LAQLTFESTVLIDSTVLLVMNLSTSYKYKQHQGTKLNLLELK